ncbi:MAG: lipopolysaccharide heptosyltransferase II [Ignavibacteriales bacterium]|nr:lipopolysaccharide heptosyltransferase II [Ignavibacteriales bacterium]
MGKAIAVHCNGANYVLLSSAVNSSPNILVVRLSSMGDVVLASPLLRVLRKRFPQSQIDFVVKKEFAELVRHNHNLNSTYELNTDGGMTELLRLKKRLTRERYELVLDLHNSLRSRYLRRLAGAQNVLTIKKRLAERTALVKFKRNWYGEIVSAADRYIEPVRRFGVQNDGKGLELHIPDEILFRVSGKMVELRLNRFEKTVGLCPGARHSTKRWPAERFAEFAVNLSAQFHAKILIFGGDEDRVVASQIAEKVKQTTGEESVAVVAGTCSLLETAAAMEFCDVIITNDTGLMHVASAMKKRVIAIFGPTVKEFGFFPVGTESVMIEREGLYCRPCSHIGRATCPEGHFRCMKEIGVGEVFAQTSKMLKAEGPFGAH